MNLKRLNPLYAIAFACFCIWLIRNDIPFILYLMNAADAVEERGVITGKEIIGGKYSSSHLIEFRSDDSSCTSTSDVTSGDYENYIAGSAITILKNSTGCTLPTDNRLHTPPGLIYLKSLFVMLAVVVALISAMWSGKKVAEAAQDSEE